MGKCEDNHIPACMSDNKANLLSRIIAPYSTWKSSAKNKLQDIGESFTKVSKFYFASRKRLVHESVHFVNIKMLWPMLVRYHFFNIICTFIMRVSYFLQPQGYGYLMVLSFTMTFGYIMHESSYLGIFVSLNENSLEWYWPNINSHIQRLSHLGIPTKYQHLTGITILIRGGRVFHIILNISSRYHAFTYIPNHH